MNLVIEQLKRQLLRRKTDVHHAAVASADSRLEAAVPVDF
jgi:hypothetical protein